MYIIDKLEVILKSSKNSSGEYILSAYLMNHLNEINDLSLKRISMETKLSRSSIIRFCQNAGYDGFTVFIDDLLLEKEELDSNLNSLSSFDFEYYKDMKSNFFKQCRDNLTDKYLLLLDAIKKGNKILFYGHNRYISSFSYLISYLYGKGKQVIDNMCWSISEQRKLFNQLQENDLIIIIEPQMTWRSYKELLTITPDALDNFNKTNAKIVYIGQDESDSVDISISLPYVLYEMIYKDFIMCLDINLTIDLQKMGDY